MGTVITPHFDLPFSLGPNGAAVVEQDTIDDVANCVVVILSVERGTRDEAPTFGIEDLAMRKQPLGASEIAEEIRDQDPRAVLIMSENPDMNDELIDRINIGVSTVRQTS